MNKFKFYIIAIISTGILFSCDDDDDVASTPEQLRDFYTQYSADLLVIETYLDTHYVESAGLTDSEPIKLTPIPTGNPDGFTKLIDDPRLHFKTVNKHEIDYKLYYLELRNGDPTKKAPVKVDEVLAGYEGKYLKSGTEAVLFEYTQYPSQFIPLDETITGWMEIFPLFRAGNIENVVGAPTLYTDYGAGALFIPSGLAYYNFATANVPSYVPLIFTFKLYDVKRADQDEDGIHSIDEDLNNDGHFNNDDSDGDGIQNYLDIDDDNDAFTTKSETLIPDSSPAAYYPYNPSVEQPLGVPSCSGDFTTPERLRKFLDPACH